MIDVAQVEARTELVKAQNIEIGATLGGVKFVSVGDLIKMAELLARAGVAVPPHCRDKAGTCFALCQQANEWGMPVMGVLNKSYVVNNRGMERIAFESQMIHAVIEKNAPIKTRLRFEIVGEGDERRCKVWGTFKGEDKPHEYISETLGKLREARGRNEQGQLKGSPLWEHQPDVQLFYSASRQWARLYCPDVILGAYTPDDAQYEPVDVTPVKSFAQRLKEAKSHADHRGFDADHVARETSARSTIIEGDINPDVMEEVSDGNPERRGNEPDHQGRIDQAGDRTQHDQHQDGSDQDGDRDQADGAGTAGSAERADQDQAEVFPPDRKARPKGKKR